MRKGWGVAKGERGKSKGETEGKFWNQNSKKMVFAYENVCKREIKYASSYISDIQVLGIQVL